MRELNLDEVKKSQLGALEAIHDFCALHNLKYFLAGGTLIGAIRHKGYIPWDDDIDLYMLRDDYEAFIDAFNSCSAKYKVYTVDNCKNYRYPFAKVCDEDTVLEEDGYQTMPGKGIYVDIFPLDNAPSTQAQKEELIKQEKKLHKYISYLSISSADRGFIKNSALAGLRILDSILGISYFGLKRNKIAKKYGDSASDEVCMVQGCAPQLEFYKRALFEKAAPVMFEGKERYAPIGYDAALRQRYGDYMKLPPEEARVSNHIFKAYAKE